MKNYAGLQSALGSCLAALALNLSAAPLDHGADHGPQPAIIGKTATQNPLAQGDEQEREPLYTCSMHPQIRSTDPGGRCPICGMALVKLPQDANDHGAAPEAASLTLSPRAMALTSIRAEPATYRSATGTLRLPGRIEIDDSRRHIVSARVNGRIDKLYVNTPGALIRRGDHVADIYSPELLAAQEEFLQAARMRSQGISSASGYRAARDKLRLLGIAETELDAIEKSGKTKDTLPVIAFGEGRVQALDVIEGQYLQTGDSLFQIADLGSVWAVLEAYESDLDFLKEGDEVEITTGLLPAQAFEGRISFIDPWVDDSKRTAGVRVTLENPDGTLKPGALVQAYVRAERAPAVLIPASAPLLTGTRALVYVQDKNVAGRFSAREVKLGQRLGEYYPVISGLEAGELVVVQGALRIDSELQIRGRPSMMAPLGGGMPAHDHGGVSTGTGAIIEAEAGSLPGSVEPEFEATPDTRSEAGNVALIGKLEPLFEAYHLAQQALADDRLGDWRTATDSLQQAVLQVSWPDFLKDVSLQLQQGRDHLQHINSLERAGDLFYQHSQAMMTMARMGLASGTWFVAFCPMASAGDDNGAHWLQRDTQLSNPYFGQSMQRCGDLQETLEGHGHE